ncbi:MAG: FkbM family methyltransferase [Bacteroidia bacterium]|nr:FkbM family methyltransferase [Bacteroidia bacterium]
MIKSIVKKIVNASGYKISRLGNVNRFVPFVKNVTVAGMDMSFWIDSEGAQYWYSEENFSLEIGQLQKIIKPGDKILDVGCNIGVLSAIMSKLTGSEGKVVAMDVFPDNCLTTCAQLGLNKITNCEVINIGASDKEQDVTIADTTNSGVLVSNGKSEVLTVKAIPIDDLLKKYGKFDLLKIDVEGYETSVLKGAKELLKSRPKIALELHGPHLKQYNTSVEELFDIMQIENYKGYILHKYSNKFEVFDPVQAIKVPPLANLFLIPNG